MRANARLPLELLAAALTAGREGTLLDRYFFLSILDDRVEEERRQYEADLTAAEADAGEETG